MPRAARAQSPMHLVHHAHECKLSSWILEAQCIICTGSAILRQGAEVPEFLNGQNYAPTFDCLKPGQLWRAMQAKIQAELNTLESEKSLVPCEACRRFGHRCGTVPEAAYHSAGDLVHPLLAVVLPSPHHKPDFASRRRVPCCWITTSLSTACLSC